MGALQNIVNQEIKSAAQAVGTTRVVQSLYNQKTEGLIKEGEALQDTKFDIDKRDLQINQTERNLSKAETNANSIQEQLKGTKVAAKKSELQEKYNLAMEKVDELRDLREMQMFERESRIARFNENVAAYDEKVSSASRFKNEKYKASFPKVEAIEGGKK